MWHKELRNFSNLTELGLLTTRLLRLEVYSKLTRGEAQLRSATQVPNLDITSEYVEHVRSTRTVRNIETKPLKEDANFLQIVSTKSTF